jgi:peroxiredoxin
MSGSAVKWLVSAVVVAAVFMSMRTYSAAEGYSERSYSEVDYMEALQLMKYEDKVKAPDFTLPAVNIRTTPPGEEVKKAAGSKTQEVKTEIDKSGGTRITGSWDKILKWANQRWGSEESASEREGLVKISLKDYRGSVVFVNFWATWCPPCKEEMPDMQKLYNVFKETNFAMLAISIDRTGSKAVIPYMDEMGLTFPALLDPDRSVSRKYNAISVPTTFLIDCGGYFVAKAIGARKWNNANSVELIKSLQEGPECEK